MPSANSKYLILKFEYYACTSWVEMVATFPTDYSERIRQRPGAFVGTYRQQGIKFIGHCHDATGQGNLISGKSTRVTGTVEFLVVAVRDFRAQS